MNRLKGFLYKFFNGRYGVDSYSYFLLAVYAFLCIVNAIVLEEIIEILTFLLLIYIFWRMMSRNYFKRHRENDKFLSVWSAIKINGKLLIDRFRYIGSARFRKCKHCKAIIKLPVKRGKHTVRCPKCGEKFDVRIIL